MIQGFGSLTLWPGTPSFEAVGRLRRTLHGPWSRACRSLLFVALALAACGVEQPPPSSPATPAPPSQAAAASAVRSASAPDAFYPGFDPARDTLPTPVDGGRVVVHLLSFPTSLNYMIDNSSVTRRMWNELHEGLIRQDLETWQYVPALAKSWTVEDQLVLPGGDVKSGKHVLTGLVEDFGDRWRIREAGTTRDVAKSEGAVLVRGSAFRFELRQGVKWQDGADFDARDVLFSLRCFRNPHVDCDEKRYQFDKIVRAQSDGPHSVRFAFAKPYFLAENVFGSLTILPAHLYDLSDPRNPDHAADADDERQARYLAEHPANRMWVGLGPYRVAEWSDTAIVAKRWEGYHDRANGGHVDEIVWRMIKDDGAAMTALLEGQLDFYDRVSGEDYLGPRTQSPEFTSRFYKGHFYAPYISYTGWNMRREKLSDVRVRTALALCFDWPAFIQSYYKGLAERVTGEQFLRGPAYDPTLQPLPYDPDRARSLLADADWYDRDQDGVVDREGVALEIEFLYPSGNRTSELSGQAFQAALEKIGVKLTLVARDWPAFMARVDKRDFDAISMGWITPPVVDPEQAWASKWAGADSANNAGLSDARVDGLIERIQVELDPTRRRELFAELQRRVYELQPYMFGVNVPRKFAMSKRVRNLQCFGLDPGYSIRRWYVIEKP